MVSSKTFVVCFFLFIFLCLTSALLVLLAFVFKNFVLFSSHLTSHAGATWIDSQTSQAFSWLLLPPNSIKLVIFKVTDEATHFEV